MMADFWDNYKDITDQVMILCVISVIQYYADIHYYKTPCRISNLSGEQYVESLIQQNHPRRIQEIFRMPLYTFLQLEIWLKEHTHLQASRHITVTEKLAMFLATTGHGTTNRGIQERFQHSGETISRCFHEVLNALVLMHAHYVQLPSNTYKTDARIRDDSKYGPYFGDCLGALDGTHIPAHVPYANRIPYRNRKGFLSQNVLAAVTFDLRYCYILPGWEGSVHDSRVLVDAVQNQGFIVPEEKYFLADAGYSNSDYVMIPYRGVRYHLKEQNLAAQKPENAKELFNLRHSSLRNAVERIFGVDKRRFKIMNTPPEYSLKTQINLIFALTGLHNFIKDHPSQDIDYFEVENEDPIVQSGGSDNLLLGNSLVTSTRMNRKRDAIADAMWVDYTSYLTRRGLVT